MDSLRRSVLRIVPVALGLPAAACASRQLTLTDLGALGTNAATVRWRSRLNESGVGFRPALADSTIWACDQRGDVVSVAAADGRRLTRFSVGAPLACGVAAGPGIVIVVDTDGRMRALDADGETLWQSALDAEPLSLPALAGSVVLIRLSNGTIVAHERGTGARRWLHTYSDAALVLRQTSVIAADAVNAYVGLSGGQMVALSLASGASLWETRISLPRGANEIERIADVVGAPVVDGAAICAAAYQGRLTCVNANNGEAIWSQDVRAASGLALSDAGMLVSLDIDGRVSAWSSRRTQLWQQDALRGRYPGAPAFIGGTVWIGDAGGVVHALDGADGRVLGRAFIDESPIIGAPVALDLTDASLAMVQTAAGTLAAIALE